MKEDGVVMSLRVYDNERMHGLRIVGADHTSEVNAFATGGIRHKRRQLVVSQHARIGTPRAQPCPRHERGIAQPAHRS